jgi:hypothetical protein
MSTKPLHIASDESSPADGSFVIAERTMLLEAKWTSEPQPASALQQGLDNRGIKAKILIVEPSLESALGILEPGTHQRQRREVLVLDDKEILSRIQYTLEAEELPVQVHKLFSLLGISIPEA